MWQHLLRLDHWKVRFILDRGERLKDCKLGLCEENFEMNNARLFILDPAVIDEETTVKDDIDYTIVHELLHLWVSPGIRVLTNVQEYLGNAIYEGYRSKAYTFEETCINQLSYIIVDMFKGGYANVGQKSVSQP